MTRQQRIAGILRTLLAPGAPVQVADIKARNGWAQTLLIGWDLTDLVRQGVIQRVRRGWYKR